MRALVLGLVLLLTAVGPAPARTPAECLERNNGYYAARTICSTAELREIDYWLYHTIQNAIRRGVGQRQEEFKRRIDQWLASRDRCCTNDPRALREFYIASLPMLRRAIIDLISQEA